MSARVVTSTCLFDLENLWRVVPAVRIGVERGFNYTTMECDADNHQTRHSFLCTSKNIEILHVSLTRAFVYVRIRAEHCDPGGGVNFPRRICTIREVARGTVICGEVHVHR
jgi:hypothetical protein